MARDSHCSHGRWPPTPTPSEDSLGSTLSDDLVLEILLRLPSVASLVRAALACRAWRRAVASSAAFRGRFRALHPPPLLGFFIEAPASGQIPNAPAFPAFAPARPRDRDLAAAVRCGDFFLTTLQDGPGEIPCWDAIYCSRGCVLLLNWDDGMLVVLEKFAKMGSQTLAFAVLPLAPHFIDTDSPTVLFIGSCKFTSGRCLQS